MTTTRPRPLARAGFATIAGLGLLGTLAACTPTQAEAEPTTGTDDSRTSTEATTAPSASAESTDGATGSGSYTDGTYDAEGSYLSPGGNESISVSITLEGDVVTAVTVTPEATSGNAVQYQKAFASGIAAEVVGKNIDDLSVDKVSGSSLTSGGFNEAVKTIKADAGS
ncbi:FMN-binding protein [Amnibacterium flavum]|uniref:FMN-binding domain-containing protein n=1 Tax=Amnibacterium flavum TaxID=2173173 RepID=A0A2V1HQK4_9MICO|nr:FMN-binding protein [Amnibacterium flavum]PVZ93912.1 hypothetical protein DDQ50_09060 [Amnibacterium flavum]